MVLIEFLNSRKDKSTLKIRFPHHISAKKPALKGRPIKKNQKIKKQKAGFLN